MGFEHFHVGKAGAPFRHGKTAPSKRSADVADASCATGAFYTAPALAASYDSMQPLTISWQPALSCLLPTPSLVDIYLYAPGRASPRMHIWEGVPYAPGTYSAEIMPRWWNATSSISLQLMVVPGGTPPFLNTIPAGPVFTATYTTNTSVTAVPAAADPAQASADDGRTAVTASAITGVSSHKLTKGATAAAVLLPLIFVLLLGALYLKFQRARGAAKRSAWSEKLDKRMSTISADWKAITPGGAREAVRHSLAVSRDSAAFSFGLGASGIRAEHIDGEPVVMGEKPRLSEEQPRTPLGSGVGVGVGARRPKTHAQAPERGSRAVSFADAAHPRPSMTGSVYSRQSRAFHTASTYGAEDGHGEAPPVPALPSPSRVSAYANSNGSGSVYGGNGNGNGSSDRGQSVYVNGGAWSSGERVEGVDGGYGAQSVSPTGRVHTINYPSASGHSPTSPYDNSTATFDASYNTYAQNDQSYFSPATPTPGASFGYDSAYGATTYAGYEGQEQEQREQQEGGAFTSPRQTAGPLTLTPDDIRRRMTLGSQHQGAGGEWRQSVNEVFGALSLMRTGGDPSSPDADDGDGDYLFAPMPETVFAYPGTPAMGSFNTPAPASPFAMPMSAPTMSPDAMLRAYAATHTDSSSSSSASGSPALSSSPLPTAAKPLALLKHKTSSLKGAGSSILKGGISGKGGKPKFVSPLSNSTAGAEVVPTYNGTGMRVLYAQPEEGGDAASVAGSGMIRAGPGARLSR
ncbi:hypothetical protein DFH09DRAFT_595930 [Mycena vulgaris]|nr:hypothetical protein DFH09DRAFT_595930 [Mycena vulgaris]